MTEEPQAPDCPQCGRPMRLQTAKRGPRRGQQFWGCTGYPNDCRFIINLGDDPVQLPAIGRRVLYSDITTNRPGWNVRFTAVGASLRAVPSPLESDSLTNVWLARTDSSAAPKPGTRHAAALLRRVVQRGAAPPLHPATEEVLLKAAGLWDAAYPSGLPGDISVRLSQGAVKKAAQVASPPHAAPPLDLDLNLPLDSDEERLFLTEWLPRVNPEAARWASPQAPLDALIAGAGLPADGARRVDFLLAPAWGQGHFIVEIDGGQHADAAAVDAARDEALRRAGFDTLRVPAEEVRAGSGEHLDAIAERLNGQAGAPSMPMAPQSTLGFGPTEVHRAVLALAEAMATGLIRGDQWVIRLEGGSEWLPEAMTPYLDLLLGFDRIWMLSAAPESVSLRADARSLDLRRSPDGYVPSPLDAAAPPTLTIVLDSLRGPCEALPVSQGIPQVVVRSANVPVEMEVSAEGFTGARRPAADDGELHWGLKQVLHAVFAKEDFREGQLEALKHVIAGRDCTVLLPTGAGKSLIYQLAGFCLPGRTLVIDPLVSLIEDQVEGLREYGIDRTIGISHYQVTQGNIASLLHQFASGDALFSFVAPERLQTQQFRNSVRALAHSTTPITLAVIDEAHCVSEWGHDFRTSYLNIGKVLRDVCSDPAGLPPSLLALTGTASHAVRKDVLFELNIKRGGVVQPETFDRPELKYHITKEDPKSAQAALIGVIGSRLPALFNVSPQEFFAPRGDRTFSGLVFCPHVNGSFGVIQIAEVLEKGLGIEVGRFSGSTTPRGYSADAWETTKRQYVTRFKKNELPVMVATKGFGMGIDKLNIRYVAHYGLPSSIEEYYQEIGRAGRDRNLAQCALLFTEYDVQRNRQLLAMDASSGQSIVDSIPWPDRDDITNQLWFHFGSFRGVDKELQDVRRLLNDIGMLGLMREVRVPFWKKNSTDRQPQERAIHRLVVLGVIGDYLIESNSFVLNMENIESHGIVDNYVDYVRRSQPSREDSEYAKAVQFENAALPTTIEGCTGLLIKFVYEFIEQSRRRSLREMWLATEDSIRNPNVDLRNRILAYLTEGDLLPELWNLAQTPGFSYEPWLQKLSSITFLNEAADLRGAAARLLPSSPTHFGLLMARGFAELVDPDGALEEFFLNMRQSLDSARELYSASDAELETLFEWLKHKSADAREGAATAALSPFFDLPLSTSFVENFSIEALDSATTEPGLRILAFACRMDEAARGLGEIATLLKEVDR